MTFIYILIGAMAIVVVFLIGIYNSLVAKRQRCNQAFADIDVQLKQRQNLIPNLVETVKGYASHERQTLEEVVQARNSAVAAQSPGEMAQAEGALTSALGRLFALSESYPDLKANENFKDLQDELSVIEDKLAAARRLARCWRVVSGVLCVVPLQHVQAAFYSTRISSWECPMRRGSGWAQPA